MLGENEFDLGVQGKKKKNWAEVKELLCRRERYRNRGQRQPNCGGCRLHRPKGGNNKRGRHWNRGGCGAVSGQGH